MLYVVVYVLPEHIWGKVKVSDARAQLRQQDADRRQRALPGDVLQARATTPSWCATPTTGATTCRAGAAQGRRDHLPGVHEPRHDGPGPAHRRRRRGAGRALGAVPRAAGRARPSRRSTTTTSTGTTSTSTATTARSRGEPGAPRPGVPRGARLRHRPRSASSSSCTTAAPSPATR